jgi:deoxyribonuclease-4
MLKIGCHLSVSGGFLNMARTALEIDANTFQFFTRNPRGGKAKALDEKDIAAFIEFARAHEIADFVAHAPYTLNICSDKENIRQFAFETFEDDLNRLECIPGCMYNFHPGSHVGQGLEEGIELIAAALNQLLKPALGTTALLETMSGKGSEIGGRFEDLRAIIDRVTHQDKLGVCLDTCHIYDAGYDIVTDLDGVLAEFDRVIGLSTLKAIHLNDSKNPLGARKDRHETIGNGHIGLDAFRRIINHPALRDLPFILETPNELPGYAEEIMLLRGMYE